MGGIFIKTLTTYKKKDAIEITEVVEKSVEGVVNGIVVVYVPHTTAGVIINESYDRDVVNDILSKITELIPISSNYRHVEGNSDAHIQSSIMGSSVCVIVKNGKLVLGRWQGIFFMEFDGPRNRKFYIKIIEG